jgi:hypothetical protein
VIGKRLRDESESAQGPMPRRWVDLIRHLDEQERRRERGESAGSAAGSQY